MVFLRADCQNEHKQNLFVEKVQAVHGFST